jgi:phage/plasmid-like protein (TIGR03299 family)
MIRFGGLDWNVIPRPLVTFDDAGMGASVGGFKALTRSDRTDVTLSVVTESYGIVQNADALALAAAIVGEDNASAEVCGALDEGRRIFLVLSMKAAGFEVAGEAIEPYIVCFAGHDGSTSVGFRFTPVRVVCQNTMSAALGTKTSAELTIRHTRNAEARVKIAAGVVASARDYFGAFSVRALHLAKQQLRLQEAHELSARLFPAYDTAKGPIIPANQGKLIELFSRQPDTSDRRVAGTKWGFFNAVTALVDHNARGGKGERRMERALAGSDIRDRAMDMLLAA